MTTDRSASGPEHRHRGSTRADGPAPPEAPADLGFGAFSDDGPWVLDADNLSWRAGVGALRAGTTRPGAGADPPAPGPARAPGSLSTGVRLGRRPGRLVRHRPRRRAAAPGDPSAVAGRAVPPAAQGRSRPWARRTSSWARSSPRARGSSRPSWSASSSCCATRCRPRPSQAVRDRRRGGAGPDRSRRCSRRFDTRAAGRRVHRPGPRRHPADRRGRRRQGAAADGRRRRCAGTWPP